MKQRARRCRIIPLFPLAILSLVGFLGGGAVTAARTEDKKTDAPPPIETKQPSKPNVSPPPTDINDLSLEVAALRTLYLFKCGPEQLGDRAAIPGFEQGKYNQIKTRAKDAAQKAHPRQEANASKNYVKLLTELRAAFIIGQEDRINELSEQLDELTNDEQPDLDDNVEITEQARKNAPLLLKSIAPDVIVSYLSAYGKDFPDPWLLLWKTMRLDGKGKKPAIDEWKLISDSVVKEIGWQIGGLDPKEQKVIADETRKLLNKAYGMTNDELKNNGKGGGGLRKELNKLVTHASPTDPLKHVLEQDLAELLSNPRLIPAIDARMDYLKLEKTHEKE